MIRKRYSLKSGARLQHLRTSLANCKQNGSSIDDYFGRLTKIWDGIATCMNSKQCSCGKCECDLNSAREQETKTLRVHDFLSGLDDATHGVIRSQICAISPLPDLDSVYPTVSQNEIIRSSVTPETPVMGSQLKLDLHLNLQIILQNQTHHRDQETDILPANVLHVDEQVMKPHGALPLSVILNGGRTVHTTELKIATNLAIKQRMFNHELTRLL